MSVGIATSVAVRERITWRSCIEVKVLIASGIGSGVHDRTGGGVVRTVGIDPSSTFCGLGIIDTPSTIVAVKHWERDKKKSHPQGFQDYFNWLIMELLIYRPQMAVIEMGAYIVSQGRGRGQGNFQAIQAVSFYQAISVLACKIQGLIVIESRATSARSAALGNGRLSKDQVWEIMRMKYPDTFSPKIRGGLDESDALVLALGGERLAER